MSREKFASTNNRYPDLGSDTSSVWNFCGRCSTSFRGETSDGDEKCRLISQATKIGPDFRLKADWNYVACFTSLKYQ